MHELRHLRAKVARHFEGQPLGSGSLPSCLLAFLFRVVFHTQAQVNCIAFLLVRALIACFSKSYFIFMHGLLLFSRPHTSLRVCDGRALSFRDTDNRMAGSYYRTRTTR